MDTSKPSRTMCAAVLRLLTDEGRRQRRDERTYSLHTPSPSARLWTSLCCGHVAAHIHVALRVAERDGSRGGGDRCDEAAAGRGGQLGLCDV